MERIWFLTNDAILHEGYVQLHYAYKDKEFPDFGAALPREKCPPLEELKKGTEIKLCYDETGYRVIGIEVIIREDRPYK